MKTATGTPTLISHGQLVDGTGRPPIPDAAVLIRDGRITYAGPERDALEVGPEAARIDARGLRFLHWVRLWANNRAT